MRNQPTIATYVDRFGETREVYKNRGSRWMTKRATDTPILKLTKCIGEEVGRRIRTARISRNMTLEELATRAGLKGIPKCRMYEIETNMSGGIRLGTLYAIALALGMEPCELLPTSGEMLKIAGVKRKSTPTLS